MLTTRKNVICEIDSPGGTNPLRMQIRMHQRFCKVGTAVSIVLGALFALGGTPAYSYSIVSGSLPANVSLNASTGAFTVTGALTAGKSVFVAQCQDAALTIFQSSFEIDIDHLLQPKFITMPPMEAGVPFECQLAVTGNTGAVTWALTNGAFPTSVSISAAGLISGTPSSAAGQYSVIVTATDAGSGDTYPLALVFDLADSINFGGPVPPTITLYKGVSYTGIPLQAEMFGGVAPFYYSFVSKPSWATFDPNTQTFYGTPDTTGSVAITVNVTDSLGGTGANLCAFTVIDPNAKIQPKKNGVSTGGAGPSIFDFLNARSLTNNGTTLTVDVGAAGSGANDPGNVSISNGFMLQYKRLTLTTTERMTGGGSTRIIGFDYDPVSYAGTPKVGSRSFTVKDGFELYIPIRLTMVSTFRVTGEGNADIMGEDTPASGSRIQLTGSSIGQ